MQILSNPFSGSSKRHWRRRRYQRLHGAITNRKNLKTLRFRGGPQRSWRIKVVPKLRLRTAILSPLKIWSKLKNAYVNMMLNLAGNVGHLNNENVFGGKRIPKARQVSKGYSSNEFENRLVFEIYKALVASSWILAHEVSFFPLLCIKLGCLNSYLVFGNWYQCKYDAKYVLHEFIRGQDSTPNPLSILLNSTMNPL